MGIAMPLSEEDLAQVREALGIDKLAEEMAKTVQKTMNGALADHTKRTAAALDKLIEPVNTKLAEFEEKAKAAPPPPPGTPEPPKPANIQDTPEFRGMQKKLADLEKKAADAEAREQAERVKAQDASLRQHVGELLASKLKIEGVRAKHAVRVIADNFKWSEDGSRIIATDSDGTETDPETWLAGWAKTEDAKIYMPPAGTRGAGTRPPAVGGSPPAGSPKDQAASRIFEELDRAL